MTADHCPRLRAALSGRLARLGLVEAECRRFGGEGDGHGAMFAGSVAFYRGNGLTIAVASSAGGGVSCFVGGDGADLDTWHEWPSLWTLPGIGEDIAKEDASAGAEPFARGFDAMIDGVAAALTRLLGP
jgi:hypothetical protein